jgi:DNA-binding MarR family transcriptional regulator
VNSAPKTEIIDSEYVILENIYDLAEHPAPLRQRELAQIAGTSLGMTNSILKRLARKGLITIKKLNSRNIRYAITLAGINEIIRRSYGYFKRTIRNAVYYKDSLDEIIHRAKRNNISTVLLVGISDLDFILEHTCHRYGLSFLKTVDPDKAREINRGETLTIYAEIIPADREGGKTAPRNTLYLSHMVMKKAAEEGGAPRE